MSAWTAGAAPGPSADAAWPRAVLELRPDGVGVLNGRQVRAAGGDVRALLIQLVIEMAAAARTPVIVEARDPDGNCDLVVWPDGTVTERALTSPGDTPAGTGRPGPDRHSAWYIGPAPAAPSGDCPPTSAREPARPDVPDPVPAPAADPAADPAAATELSTPHPAPRPAPARVRLPTGSDVVLPVLSPDAAVPGPGPRRALELPGPAAISAPAPAIRALPPGPSVSAGPADGPALRALPAGPVFPSVRRILSATTLAVGGAAVAVVLGVAVLTHSTSPAPRPAAGAATGALTGSASGSPQVLVGAAKPAMLTAVMAGFAAQPLCGRPVLPRTKTAAADDGTVLTRDPHGTLLRVHASTGTVTWYASGQWGQGWDGPWLTQIDGQAVAVLVSAAAGQLASWRLPVNTLAAASGPAGDPQRVQLPAGASVTWAGPSPLVTTPTGQAGVIADGRVQLLSLPAGAQALAATGRDLLAVHGQTWLRATLGPSPAAPAIQTHTIPLPSGASGGPARAVAVGADYLLAIWPVTGGQQPIALIPTDGKTAYLTALPSGLDITRAPVVRQVHGSLTAVGPIVIDTDLQRIDVLLPSYTPQALVRGHVYAMHSGVATDIGLGSNGIFLASDKVDPHALIPFAAMGSGTNRIALVISTASDGPHLLALRATQ